MTREEALHRARVLLLTLEPNVDWLPEQFEMVADKLEEAELGGVKKEFETARQKMHKIDQICQARLEGGPFFEAHTKSYSEIAGIAQQYYLSDRGAAPCKLSPGEWLCCVCDYVNTGPICTKCMKGFPPPERPKTVSYWLAERRLENNTAVWRRARPRCGQWDTLDVHQAKRFRTKDECEAWMPPNYAATEHMDVPAAEEIVHERGAPSLAEFKRAIEEAEAPLCPGITPPAAGEVCGLTHPAERCELPMGHQPRTHVFTPIIPEIGQWKCDECGKQNFDITDGSWRFNGKAWEHKCSGRAAQAGHASAHRIDQIKSLKIPPDPVEVPKVTKELVEELRNAGRREECHVPVLLARDGVCECRHHADDHLALDDARTKRGGCLRRCYCRMFKPKEA